MIDTSVTMSYGNLWTIDTSATRRLCAHYEHCTRFETRQSHRQYSFGVSFQKYGGQKCTQNRVIYVKNNLEGVCKTLLNWWGFQCEHNQLPVQPAIERTIQRSKST